MYFSKLITTLSVIAMVGAYSGSAMAAHSEFFYQAKDGQHVFTGTPGYRMGSTETSTTTPVFTTTDKDSGWGLGLGYEYGVMKMMSLGLDLQYWNASLEETYSSGTPVPSRAKRKQTGWENIMLKAKLFHEFNTDWSLYYGLNFGISLKDQNEVNYFSGRHSLDPYVGIQHMMSANVKWGLLADYDLKLGGNRMDNTMNKVKMTGGSVLGLTLFGEYGQNSWLAGLSAKYSMMGKVKESWTNKQSIDADGNAIGGDPSGISYELASRSFLTLKGYATFAVADAWDLLPSLSYMMSMSDAYRSDMTTTQSGASSTAASVLTRKDSLMLVELGVRYKF